MADDVEETFVRIRDILKEANQEDRALRQEVGRMWLALIIWIGVGSLVTGALATHVWMDQKRFDEMKTEIASMRLEMVRLHHDEYHAKEQK